MRKYLMILAVSISLVLGGCNASGPEQPKAAAGSEYVPTATIKDIMDSIVDPNADFLWNAVSTTISAKGVDSKFPRTDEEWKEVRRHAIALVEAPNLLLMPNRRVAKPGEKADYPEVEESPEAIEALIKGDRATFENRAHGLREAALKILAAIDAKDVMAVEDSGDDIDKACEACHLVYWYPKDKFAGELYRQSLRPAPGNGKK